VIEDRPEYIKDWTPEQLAERERSRTISRDHQSQNHALGESALNI